MNEEGKRGEDGEYQKTRIYISKKEEKYQDKDETKREQRNRNTPGKHKEQDNTEKRTNKKKKEINIKSDNKGGKEETKKAICKIDNKKVESSLAPCRWAQQSTHTSTRNDRSTKSLAAQNIRTNTNREKVRNHIKNNRSSVFTCSQSPLPVPLCVAAAATEGEAGKNTPRDLSKTPTSELLIFSRGGDDSSSSCISA